MSKDYVGWGGANSYSTEEQVIGTWIDGKPLYQKVIMSTSGVVANVKRVIQWVPLRNESKTWFAGPYYKDSIDCVVLEKSGDTFSLTAPGNDRLDFYDGFIITYTKTTD